MTPFSYRLDARDGHRFDPPPSEFEAEIRQIILNRAGYSALPLDVPFVGHFPLPNGAYVILGKPAGQQGYDGWVLSGLQYAGYQYSPYGFLAENAPKMGIDRASGPPLDATGFDHTLSYSTGYLKTAARIFAGFDEAHRLRAHRSVAAPDRDGADALFVLPKVAQTQLPAGRPASTTPTPIDELGTVRNDVAKLRGLVETLRSHAQPTAADTTARIANLTQRLTDIEAALRVAAEATEQLNAQRRDDTAKAARSAEQAATRTAALETQVADLANTVGTLPAAQGGGRLRWALPVAAAAVLVAAGGIVYTAISTQTVSEQVTQTIAMLGNADNPAAGTMRRQMTQLSSQVEQTLGRADQPGTVLGRLSMLEKSDVPMRVGKLEQALGNTNPSDTGTVLARLAALDAANPLGRVGKIEKVLGDGWKQDSGTVLDHLGKVKANVETAYQFLQDACSVLANVKGVEQRILALCKASFPTQQAGQAVRP
ncbi:hypothetical protein ACN2CC_02080 [Mesorhizobium muleiense]|uniref:hypothetical protein n=1 Tax=Mesorhizobium muleiense TaxID=1004279 RepID=UPI003AFB662B